MGFLNNISEKINEFNDCVNDLKNDFKKFKQEMYEELTDGFVEIVIKDKEFKTSYEIEAEANKRVDAAEKRYENLFNKSQRIFEKVQKKILLLGKFKLYVQNTVITDWIKILQKNDSYVLIIDDVFKRKEKLFDFLKFDTLEKIKKISLDATNYLKLNPFIIYSIGIGSLSSNSNYSFSKLSSSIKSIYEPVTPFVLKSDINFNRREKSLEYLEAVKKYETMIELHIQKFKQCLLILESISLTIRKTWLIIKKLERTLIEINNDMNLSDNISKELIDFSYYIVTAINTISNERIINDDGFPTEKSAETINQIEELISKFRKDNL